MLIESFLVSFVQFYFLTQTDDFAKAIAHGWRPFLPIFKMVSFLEYLIFFKAVFYIEKLYCAYRVVFGVFCAILFFDPN